MNTRILTDEERAPVLKLLARTRRHLEALSDGDAHLLWAMRRKLYKELIYDERGKPAHRVNLKRLKVAAQKGRCTGCRKALPESYNILDRVNPMDGYTEKNTRVICVGCDTLSQRTRRYR